MSDYKYTNDGKKVLVVGKLNAQETIVQEVFVSGEQEIPSGENFVVKSLHDAPSESWKEKNLRELEERYDRAKAELERRNSEAVKRLGLARGKAKETADALFLFAKNAEDGQLDLLKSFMAGEITHYAIPSRHCPEIRTVEDNANFDVDSHYGNRKVDGLKLVSLLGKSDGNLEYRQNQYRDGSGSWTTIIPCRSYDEAVEVLQGLLDEQSAKYLSDEASKNMSVPLSKWEKIEGVVISKEVSKKSKNKLAESMKARIEKLRGDLEEEEEKLQGLQNEGNGV